jgi:aryl-alcohol dehydrogenase-like predicted oxidoreductase
MEFTNLGPADGRTVSTLCLGTMIFGTVVDEPASFAILDRFREAGGTFLDTADCYSFWIDGATGRESEELVGRWLASRGCRDEMVIATKLGAQPDPERGGDWPRNAEGLSRTTIRAAALGSRERLGVERIDLLFAHIEDKTVGLEETVAGFGALVAEGVVGAVGCSNHTTSRIKRARVSARVQGVAGFRAVQQRHSFLRPRPGADFGFQEAADDELLELVRAEDDLTLLAYSPLLSGCFTREDRDVPAEYESPENAKRIQDLRDVAAELGVTANQAALAWLLRGDPPVLPVIGVSTVAQLEESLGAFDVRFADEQLARLAV